MTAPPGNLADRPELADPRAHEDTALRLAPSWVLPVARLPMAAGAVGADPPDEMWERRRLGTKG